MPLFKISKMNNFFRSKVFHRCARPAAADDSGDIIIISVSHFTYPDLIKSVAVLVAQASALPSPVGKQKVTKRVTIGVDECKYFYKHEPPFVFHNKPLKYTAKFPPTEKYGYDVCPYPRPYDANSIREHLKQKYGMVQSPFCDPDFYRKQLS
jgi:hypothetical protein